MHVIDSHAHVDEYEAFSWYDPPETLSQQADDLTLYEGMAKAAGFGLPVLEFHAALAR
jgi:hypothetical protein